MAGVFQPNVFQNTVFQTGDPDVTFGIGYGFSCALPIPLIGGLTPSDAVRDASAGYPTPCPWIIGGFPTPGTIGEGGPPGGFFDIRKEGAAYLDWLRKKRKRRYAWLTLSDLYEMLALAEAELERAKTENDRAQEQYEKQDNTQQSFIWSLSAQDEVEELEDIISEIRIRIREAEKQAAEKARKLAMQHAVESANNLVRDATARADREIILNTKFLTGRSEELRVNIMKGDLQRQAIIRRLEKDKAQLDSEQEDEAIALLMLRE